MRANGRRRIQIPWAAPHVLLAGFAALVSLVYLLGATQPPRSVPPPAFAVAAEEGALGRLEVRYAVVDAQGLERPGFVDIDVPAGHDAPQDRLRASLLALRDDLASRGVWPAPLEAPTGFVLDLDRRRVAIVDVPAVAPGLTVDLATELAVVRSVVATARLAVAADEVRVTVDGEERSSLWGRVALASDGAEPRAPGAP